MRTIAHQLFRFSLISQLRSSTRVASGSSSNDTHRDQCGVSLQWNYISPDYRAKGPNDNRGGLRARASQYCFQKCTSRNLLHFKNFARARYESRSRDAQHVSQYRLLRHMSTHRADKNPDGAGIRYAMCCAGRNHKPTPTYPPTRSFNHATTEPPTHAWLRLDM